MGASAAPRFHAVRAQTEWGKVVSEMEKWVFVRVVVAVRAVAFQPVRKVMRQQRAVWVILRWGGQEVGSRGWVVVVRRFWSVVGWMDVGIDDDGVELLSMVSCGVGCDEIPSTGMVDGSDGCGDMSCFLTVDKS